ncbi:MULTISPECIES: copper amine oxidase N-terminal domain-containing protein [unclassified Paenibacillus]|uniref:copper amine oxidase N-terminal domain-containing protein n=1 Tax=unclassified Paenibacillus TaxID=185978 RepID=UPI0008D8CB22|nr:MULTISPECIES: copper amine oxidase N-terminal domain-containing protein [unclassified Paenibacillus]QLG36807.1 copper amine oxidase N-terminal domain-containing protein [Paenibacillus sp. E222]SEM71485.1 Copper amine oxidase N-terminal domain-containing protein [Paenibacillus sp. OK076]
MMKQTNTAWQQKKWKMILAASILTAGTAPALLSSTVAEAATTHKPTAYINNVQAQNDVVIKQGITYVALTELQFLGDYTFGYNNKTKQISISTDSDKYVLIPNSKTMKKNGQNATLSSAPILVNGKAMLPLRAIGEAFGAQVRWNQTAKEAYIYTTDAAVVKDYSSADLTVAREAALHLPRFSELGQARLEIRNPLGPVDSSIQYIFEQGKKESFFIVEDNDLISYYTIKNENALLKWQANIGKDAGTIGDLFFIKTKPVAEAGTRPSVKGQTLVSFKYSRMLEETSYEIMNKSGSIHAGSIAPEKGKVIVEVPEEK